MAGTIVGRTNGIGMAPDAQWIACKACNGEGCSTLFALLECGQWAVCPDGYTQRCTIAPRISANSWGTSGVDVDYFNLYLVAYNILDIVPVFAIGNSGSGLLCGLTDYPGICTFFSIFESVGSPQLFLMLLLLPFVR